MVTNFTPNVSTIPMTYFNILFRTSYSVFQVTIQLPLEITNSNL